MPRSEPTPFGRGPIVVLDTNVVMDWLVFRDPSSAPWANALAHGQAQWCASAAMRDELAHVLARGVGARWAPDMAQLWSKWNRFCSELPQPAISDPAARIRCSDPTDQMFIDFALAHGARWLVSHDRAVLKLARQARFRGLAILKPTQWTGGALPP